MDDGVILVLVRDLIFSTKITATAAAVGGKVRVVRDPGKLGTEAARRVIVDLNLAGAIEAVQEYKQAQPAVEVVGFVSHVDTSTIEAARAAGADRVVARSGFVEILPSLLAP